MLHDHYLLLRRLSRSLLCWSNAFFVLLVVVPALLHSTGRPFVWKSWRTGKVVNGKGNRNVKNSGKVEDNSSCYSNWTLGDLKKQIRLSSLTKQIIWLPNYQIRPTFRLEHESDQTLKPTKISTSLLCTIGSQSVISDAIDEWCKTANIFRRAFVTKDNILNILMWVFTILRSEEKSSDFC